MRKILLCLVIILLVCALTDCSLREELAGGLVPLTDKQLNMYKQSIVSSIEDDENLRDKFSLDMDTVVIKPEKEDGTWFAYAFSKEDPALGILAVGKNKHCKLEYEIKNFEARKSLKEYVNRLRPDNESLTEYMGYAPYGIKTSRYNAGENNVLCLYVVRDSFAQKDRLFVLQEEVEKDFCVLQKAMKLNSDAGLSDIAEIKVCYIKRNSLNMQELLKSYDTENFLGYGLDRSAIVSNMCIDRAGELVDTENMGKVLFSYDVKLVNSVGDYIQGINSTWFLKEVENVVVWK